MRLCKEKATGKVVAVKKLQKSEMLRRGQVRRLSACEAAGSCLRFRSRVDAVSAVHVTPDVQHCMRTCASAAGEPALARSWPWALSKTCCLRHAVQAEVITAAVQVAHVKAERNVLAEVQNQFIVKLYYSFQVRPAEPLM